MRLLDTETQVLKSFPGRERPCYAILSHTWEDEQDEVLFVNIFNKGRDWRQKAGAYKVLGSCRLARQQGYKYIWIDTCCIDKNSSAELSEAINSMFDWYMKAEVCYVYLTDVAESGSIAECRWFQRGWTLQELIAPTFVGFYDSKWQLINDKISMSSELAKITGIDESLLRCGHSVNPPLEKDHHMQEAPSKGCSCGRPYSVSRLSQLREYCVAQKMSWASTRQTTRDEDIAYSLMGLFDINMPLIYGEGSVKAFYRLQREILGTTNDQSILAIDYFPRGIPRTALASHPIQFQDSGTIDFMPYSAFRTIEDTKRDHNITIELTKDGVNVDLLVVPDVSNRAICYGILDFHMGKNPLGRPAIPLRVITNSDTPPELRCLRGEGLFEISPEYLNCARNVRVSTGESDLKTVPDRLIRMQAVKRKKVMILRNMKQGGHNHGPGLPAPIHCIGKSPGCAPYSVESEIPGYAILRKSGYPRLLIHTLEELGVNEWSSRVWSTRIFILDKIHFSHGFMPDNAEDAGKILSKMKEEDAFSSSNKVCYPDSETLIVYGSSRLHVEVEVSVRAMEFLDWTMPEVTVYTTERHSLKRKREP